ncbi:MAG: zinc ribbon domain-containing protein [Nitrososphaerales archaeon]|nr:zinc ribbon domain-containing protein [Nitrososphaerales archaeon]
MSVRGEEWDDGRSAQRQQSSALQPKQLISPCPYCGASPLVEGICARCGTICSRCGTPYHADYCPVCYGEELGDVARAQAAMGASSPAPYGDSAPSRSELSRIIDHPATVKEHNIARGIHVDAVEKAVHDRASAAVAQLDVSPEVRARILGEVEREAVAIRKRAKKNGNSDDYGRKNGGITLEKAVAFAFLRQCRGIGRSVEEMQRALARAGFGIRLESVHIMIATRDPGNLRLFVNGCERSVRIARSPKLVRVPIYLSDLLEKDGGEEGEAEIRVGGDGAIIEARSPYESDQPDWQTLRVFVGRRCFYLFKAQKDVTVRPDWAATGTAALYPQLSVNVEALTKRFLPSKFPISSMLMNATGCLREVELRFVSLFREMIKDAHGRSPEKVAAEALYFADQDVFDSLPIAEKSLVRSMILRMGLASGGYLGKKGLLLRSEVGFDEVIREPSQEGETEEGDEIIQAADTPVNETGVHPL